jgi:hypothetical protein
MTPQIETAPREQNQKAAFRSKGKLTAGAAFVVALIAIGAVPRILRHQGALAAVNESPVTHPVVTTVRPRTGEASSALLLPGNIQPLYSANVFARTEGTWSPLRTIGRCVLCRWRSVGTWGQQWRF